jgi:Protein of unknown function (DUF1375)
MKTLNPAKNHVDIAHEGQRSYCKNIPRVYSGVAVNLCKLNGEPSRTENMGNELGDVPFFVIDTVFCLAADTVVLPYTIFRQAKDGNLTVN